jgi:hypothetical protein
MLAIIPDTSGMMRQSLRFVPQNPCSSIDTTQSCQTPCGERSSTTHLVQKYLLWPDATEKKFIS